MKTTRSMLSLLVLSQIVFAGGCVTQTIDDADADQDVTPSSYAEDLYSDFSEFADSSVTFSVETRAEGRLDRLEDAPRDLLNLIGSPDHAVASTVSAIRLHGLGYVDLEPDAGVADYMADVLQELEDEGLSAHEGGYRVLTVTTSLDGEVRQHGAVEICWDAQSRCTLIDPAMVFAEAQVNGVRERRAAGWAPVITLGDASDVDGGDVMEANVGSGAMSDGNVEDGAITTTAAVCHVKGEAESVKSKTWSEDGFDQKVDSSWKIHVGKLTSKVACSVVNGACKAVSTLTAEDSYAIGAPSSSYYKCAKVKAALTYSNSPGLVKNLMNTGCAFTYSASKKPSLSYKVSAGIYPWMGKIETTYFPYLADNLNGLTHQVTCTF